MLTITPHRAAALALSVLALVAGVTQVVWSITGDPSSAALVPGYLPRQISYGLFVIAAGGLGTVILVRTTPRRDHSLVAVALALMGLPLLSYGVGSTMSLAGAPDWAFNSLASLGFFMALAATYRLSQSFPHMQALGMQSRLGPWIGALLLWSAVRVDLLPLTPRVGMALAFGVAVASLINWRRMYKAADADGRRRVLWLVQGLVAFAVIGGFQVSLVVLVQTTPLEIPIPGWEYWLRTVALFVALGFIAVAVFYRGALDPGLVVRRTALYGLSGVVLVFVFTAVEDLTASWLADRLGLSENAGSWLAGGVVALLLGPIHAALSKRASGAPGAPRTLRDRNEPRQ